MPKQQKIKNVRKIHCLDYYTLLCWEKRIYDGLGLAPIIISFGIKFFAKTIGGSKCNQNKYKEAKYYREDGNNFLFFKGVEQGQKMKWIINKKMQKYQI